jgi:hypothetical protein
MKTKSRSTMANSHTAEHFVNPDDDCTMWTLGHFTVPPIRPYEVFERTNMMAGPAHPPEHVSAMIVTLRLGEGDVHQFDNLADAIAFMQNSMLERFAFGYAQPNTAGHMVNAWRLPDGTVQFRDFQPVPHGGVLVQPPRAAGMQYLVYPVKDADQV